MRQSPDVELTQPVSVSKGGRGKKGGIRHAANKLGLNREEARRSVKIDGSSRGQAKKFAKNTASPITSGSYKQRRKRRTPRLLVNEVVRREKLATEAKRETESATEEFVNWLLEHADDEDIPKLISWIETAKPKDVVAALRAP